MISSHVHSPRTAPHRIQFLWARRCAENIRFSPVYSNKRDLCAEIAAQNAAVYSNKRDLCAEIAAQSTAVYSNKRDLCAEIAAQSTQTSHSDRTAMPPNPPRVPWGIFTAPQNDFARLNRTGFGGRNASKEQK